MGGFNCTETPLAQIKKKQNEKEFNNKNVEIYISIY
tara:strand:+ start:77 stop:184 length:108 start_codon:yes stop_codon:yes gene_type:complete